MNREEVFQWVDETYETKPDYPWKDCNAVLRHTRNRKWYGVVLGVSGNKLGLADDAMVDVLNVKCDPMMIGSLRLQPGYFPAYHMNKERWISILLDGTVSEENVKNLISMSFGLTK